MWNLICVVFFILHDCNVIRVDKLSTVLIWWLFSFINCNSTLFIYFCISGFCKPSCDFSHLKYLYSIYSFQTWEVAADLDPDQARVLAQEVQYALIVLVEWCQKTGTGVEVHVTPTPEIGGGVLYQCDGTDQGQGVLDGDTIGQALTGPPEVTDDLVVEAEGKVGVVAGLTPDRRRDHREYMAPQTFKIWNSWKREFLSEIYRLIKLPKKN